MFIDAHPLRLLFPGVIALGLLVMVMTGALGALAVTAWGHVASTTDGNGAISDVLTDPYLWRVVRFTLLQAGLSAVLSVGLALPVARAITRRPVFFGRTFLLRLFALPLALPALVVVLGLIEIWGRQGWLSMVVRDLGLMDSLDSLPGIYGLSGILLAHVFFNLPLSVRLMVMLLERIPGENWRLAAQLGMRSWAIFRLLEWPVLRAGLPAVFSLVFMLCIASFTVVLTLGGGPAATTVEVAIYQSLRFDFDPGRAVILSLVQLAMTGILIALGTRLTMPMSITIGLGRRIMRPDGENLGGRIVDGLVIAMAAIFVITPLIALVLSSLGADYDRLFHETIVWQAMLTSLWIGGLAALLCLALAWSLVMAVHRANRITARGIRADTMRTGFVRSFVMACETGSNLILVMPPIVLGAGWFIMLHGLGASFAMAPLVVVTINALMALPYAVRILGPAQANAAANHDRLCDSLGISGWARWRIVDWPVLRPVFGLAFAFALVLSLGDLGAVALFGSQDLTTLPLLILQRMGSYRTSDAVGLAVVLMLFCLFLIMLAERGAERSGGTRSGSNEKGRT